MSNLIQGVSCEICQLQRLPGEIHARESRLLPGTKLLVCNVCEEDKKEPRSFIIIVARTSGPASVRDYIKNHRYEGKTITAKEILK